jgi:hypothetical protein
MLLYETGEPKVAAALGMVEQSARIREMVS